MISMNLTARSWISLGWREKKISRPMKALRM